jgi:hypothetical protein
MRDGNEEIERRLEKLEYDAMAETNKVSSKEDADKFFHTWRVRPNSRVAYGYVADFSPISLAPNKFRGWFE